MGYRDPYACACGCDSAAAGQTASQSNAEQVTACPSVRDMRVMLSFVALFGSIFLLQLGSGGIAPLDALVGLAAGFSTVDVGLLGSAHFLGFLLGCWWAPRLMGGIGHSRAFAVYTALGTVGILGHTLIDGPLPWALLRVMSGVCIAGCYTIVESWLQSKVTNSTRGRAVGTYRAVDITGSLVAQLLIGVLDPASYVSYNILALLCVAALLPLAMTRQTLPQVPHAPRLRPIATIRASPLAAAGVVVAGTTAAAFRMVGPVYGIEIGLAPEAIALFLAAFVAGGVLGQIPAGWSADRFDRRTVLIALSGASAGACGLVVALSSAGAWGAMAGAGIFGLVTFPIYSVATAHAHDFATDDRRVELSAGLMFLFAVGAVAAPYGAAVLIDAYGPSSLFAALGAVHLALLVFGLVRRGKRAADTRTAYVVTPRTSFLTGRLLRRPRR